MITHFKDRLHDLRIEKGVTLKGIQHETGISSGLSSLYEHGVSVPGFWNLLELARYFNVSLDYMAGITSERKEYPIE